MNFLTITLMLLVYIGGLELHKQTASRGKRHLWPVMALVIGSRKVAKVCRDILISNENQGEGK